VNDQTDQQLLRDYAERQSETAFAELVRRHVDLVYSAALRMVGDPHLAKDVTQAVFVALAQNARQLTDHPVFSGWLHRTAQNIASKIVRTDVRRRAREQEAAAMNELLSAEPNIVWEHIAPHLDAALGELSEPDRDALFLRYFEHKSAREMAQTLGTSEDAAQKRVNRAVERLRELFAKRGVTAGASGLVIAIAANAVQAAPVGLAVTISTAAALAATTLTTTAIATATKAIAMTLLQKTIIGAALATAVGTGIYEARQVSTLRGQVQSLQQQQTPLAEQIQQLHQERDDAVRQLATQRDEHERLNRNAAELLKLRGEAAWLKNNPLVLNPADASSAAVAKSWLNRVSQLKQYVDQNPNEKIPEFQFLTDREWLNTADAGLGHDDFQTPDEYRRAMESLRFEAEGRFGNLVQIALREYSSANNGQFPNNLSQLEPYCEPVVMDTLRELYEIKPANILPERVREDISTKFDWVITRKQRVNSYSTSRLAIFAYGNAYWQSPP
jgi:RNA polymerase sigma factor (sigma-70 family)